MRLRWEYTPGSELFIGCNEEQTADDPRAAVQGNRTRTLAFKFNRFVRFRGAPRGAEAPSGALVRQVRFGEDSRP